MIYLDNNATTRIDPLVLSEMMPYLTGLYGNPSSRHHSFGWKAEEAIEHAREQVAALINANPHEIIFTSGATESNNMALKCTNSQKIIITSIEHSSILKPCEWLKANGCHVSMMSVGSDGIVIADRMPVDADLTSVMLANNETGVIQPVEKFRKLFDHVRFHSDMAQALGKISIDVKELDVDYASFSGHKIYGPKGVGALYIKDGTDNHISPLLHGGGHEKGLRAGTQNVPAIVGFGKACEIAKQRLEDDQWFIKTLKYELRNHLLDRLGFSINFYGETVPQLPGCLCFSLTCDNMDVFMTRLCQDVAVSSGSACLSFSGSISYVLTAMGVPEDEVKRSIRVSIGRFNTKEDIRKASDYIIKAFEESRR
jgi:cysteine desulfurase